MRPTLKTQRLDPAIRSRQNIGQALLDTLRSLPLGAPETLLRDSLVGAGVEQRDFDMVLRSYINAGWLRRDGDRLYSGGVR